MVAPVRRSMLSRTLSTPSFWKNSGSTMMPTRVESVIANPRSEEIRAPDPGAIIRSRARQGKAGGVGVRAAARANPARVLDRLQCRIRKTPCAEARWTALPVTRALTEERRHATYATTTPGAQFDPAGGTGHRLVHARPGSCGTGARHLQVGQVRIVVLPDGRRDRPGGQDRHRRQDHRHPRGKPGLGTERDGGSLPYRQFRVHDAAGAGHQRAGGQGTRSRTRAIRNSPTSARCSRFPR